MDEIFVEISWKEGTKEQAVERAASILHREGWDSGSFCEVDGQEGKSVCGNLEVEEGLYEKVEAGRGEWSATDGVATVRFECP
jgi:hypothetical protein